MTTGRALGRIALMLAGLLAWAAQFATVYGVAGLVCAGRIPAAGLAGLQTVPLATAVATAAAVLLIAIVVWTGWRRRRTEGDTEPPSDHFLAVMTTVVCGIALVSVLVTAVPAFLEPTCTSDPMWSRSPSSAGP